MKGHFFKVLVLYDERFVIVCALIQLFLVNFSTQARFKTNFMLFYHEFNTTFHYIQVSISKNAKPQKLYVVKTCTTCTLARKIYI